MLLPCWLWDQKLTIPSWDWQQYEPRHFSARYFISNLFTTFHNFIQAFESDFFFFFEFFHFDPGPSIVWSLTFYLVGPNRHFFLGSQWFWWPGVHLWSTFFMSNWTTGRQRFLPHGLSTRPFPPCWPQWPKINVQHWSLFSKPIFKTCFQNLFSKPIFKTSFCIYFCLQVRQFSKPF